MYRRDQKGRENAGKARENVAGDEAREDDVVKAREIAHDSPEVTDKCELTQEGSGGGKTGGGAGLNTNKKADNRSELPSRGKLTYNKKKSTQIPKLFKATTKEKIQKSPEEIATKMMNTSGVGKSKTKKKIVVKMRKTTKAPNITNKDVIYIKTKGDKIQNLTVLLPKKPERKETRKRTKKRMDDYVVDFGPEETTEVPVKKSKKKPEKKTLSKDSSVQVFVQHEEETESRAKAKESVRKSPKSKEQKEGRREHQEPRRKQPRAAAMEPQVQVENEVDKELEQIKKSERKKTTNSQKKTKGKTKEIKAKDTENQTEETPRKKQKKETKRKKEAERASAAESKQKSRKSKRQKRRKRKAPENVAGTPERDIKNRQGAKDASPESNTAMENNSERGGAKPNRRKSATPKKSTGPRFSPLVIPERGLSPEEPIRDLSPGSSLVQVAPVLSMEAYSSEGRSIHVKFVPVLAQTDENCDVTGLTTSEMCAAIQKEAQNIAARVKDELVSSGVRVSSTSTSGCDLGQKLQSANQNTGNATQQASAEDNAQEEETEPEQEPEAENSELDETEDTTNESYAIPEENNNELMEPLDLSMPSKHKATQPEEIIPNGLNQEVDPENVLDISPIEFPTGRKAKDDGWDLPVRDFRKRGRPPKPMKQKMVSVADPTRVISSMVINVDLQSQDATSIMASTPLPASSSANHSAGNAPEKTSAPKKAKKTA